MVLIIYSQTNQCEWLVLDDYNQKILKTKTKYFGSIDLDIFQICIVLSSVKDLFDLREKIKSIFFYGEGSNCEKHKSNLRLVFRDYFYNANVQFDKTSR